MKQIISSKFFLTLQDASQTGIDVDAKILKAEYDDFVKFVFSEDITITDRVIYRQTLLFANVELSSLALVSGKKCGVLS